MIDHHPWLWLGRQNDLPREVVQKKAKSLLPLSATATETSNWFLPMATARYACWVVSMNHAFVTPNNDHLAHKTEAPSLLAAAFDYSQSQPPSFLSTHS